MRRIHAFLAQLKPMAIKAVEALGILYRKALIFGVFLLS